MITARRSPRDSPKKLHFSIDPSVEVTTTENPAARPRVVLSTITPMYDSTKQSRSQNDVPLGMTDS